MNARADLQVRKRADAGYGVWISKVKAMFQWQSFRNKEAAGCGVRILIRPRRG